MKKGYKVLEIRVTKTKDIVCDIAIFSETGLLVDGWQLCTEIKTGISYSERSKHGQELPPNFINDMFVVA